MRFYELFLELYEDIRSVDDKEIVFYYVYYKNATYDHKFCYREPDMPKESSDIEKYLPGSGQVQ